MSEPTVTTEEMRLWQESTPEDYSKWDWETVSDCDGFLTIAINRLEAAERVVAMYERDIPKLTRKMEFHPEGWDHLCECKMCMSYETG
ncbi:MAG: hypothetical protein KOO63_08270 [Bacteroidales bacterium]|nr:hypothetical protein [Candidatus Latescibacterota bacterium]